VALEKVMIVDDERAVAKSIQRILELDGYEVIMVTVAQEAIEKAKELRPDIILLDIMMPEISGIEACKILREQEETQTIPIIMVTARYEEETITSAIETGADDYIVKPFNPDVLKETIRHTLSLARKNLLACQLKTDIKKLKKMHNKEE